MLKRIAFGTLFVFLLIVMLISSLGSHLVEAPVIISIRADGSVDPLAVPIVRNGNVYTLTDNIYGSIVLFKDDIIVDGGGYILQGTGIETGIDVTAVSNYMNVTIRNVKIMDFAVGIKLSAFNGGMISGNTITNCKDGIRVSGFGHFSSFNNIIFGNTLTNNENGIVTEGYVVGNVISENTITDNTNYGIAFITWMLYHSPAEGNFVCENIIMNNGKGIYFSESSSNFIYHNNFVNNTEQVCVENSVSVWDDGYLLAAIIGVIMLVWMLMVME